jgi:hypothetical protein
MTKQEYKKQLDREILAAIQVGLHRTYKEIGDEFGVCEVYVGKIAKRSGWLRKRGLGSTAARLKRQAKQGANQ